MVRAGNHESDFKKGVVSPQKKGDFPSGNLAAQIGRTPSAPTLGICLPRNIEKLRKDRQNPPDIFFCLLVEFAIMMKD